MSRSLQSGPRYSKSREPQPRFLSNCGILLLSSVSLATTGSAQALPDPPVLRGAFVPPQAVRLAWDAAGPECVLEGSVDLVRWDTILSAPQLVDGKIALTVPEPDPAFFWRLRIQKTSGMAGGRNFLRNSQGDSGAWGTGSETAILFSASVLDTLLQLAGTDPSLDSTVQFALDSLASATTRNNDELSRMVIALAAGGRPVDGLVAELLGSQNPKIPNGSAIGYPGSGWGLANSFGDTTIDTALVLRALKAAEFPAASLGLSVVKEPVAAGASSPPHPFTVPVGASGILLQIRQLSGNARFNLTRPNSSTSYFDATPGGVPVTVNFGTPTAGTWSMTVVNTAGAPLTYSAEVVFTTAEGFDVSRLTSAVSYLGFAQNPDGGWGILPGSDSHLMITHEVMKALANQGNGFTHALEAGASWLATTKRNPDGGFSSEPGPSNVLETALAVLAIRLSGQPIALDSALAFIRSKQLLNGSWQSDPYITSLAALALAQPPLVTPIPSQNVLIPGLFAQIQLDDFVTDPDHADSEITWSVAGQTALSVSITNRVATITYPAATELSETLTFTATDPDGLSASTTATFSASLAPLYDYSIARGGSVTGTRSFTTTPENLARIASLTYTMTGLAPGVTYTTIGAWLVDPDTIEIDYRISVGTGAATGLEDFSVEYGIKDAAGVILSPVFNNLFNFTIQITP